MSKYFSLLVLFFSFASACEGTLVWTKRVYGVGAYSLKAKQECNDLVMLDKHHCLTGDPGNRLAKGGCGGATCRTTKERESCVSTGTVECYEFSRPNH